MASSGPFVRRRPSSCHRHRANSAAASIALVTFLCFLTGLDSASAVRYVCPPIGSAPLVLPLADGSSAFDPLVLNATAQAGELCTLTLRDAAGFRPVARSYDGKDWEVTAGPLSETLESPSCSDAPDTPVPGQVRHCSFSSIPPPVNNDTAYVLTTYGHPGFGDAAEASRFLEQATFGPTKTTINDLVASGLNFQGWIESQIALPATSLRETYRRNANPRYEYAGYPGGAGPAKACDSTSHWRTFALTRRDGIRSSQTKQSKYLHIELVNGRYVWKVEGMARTTTATLPVLLSSDGDFIENFQLFPAALYQIHFNDNDRKDCLGCPVKVVRFPGHQVGYVDNPVVDLTGIAGDASLVPYTVVDLPPIMDNSSDGMIAIDDPSPELSLSPYYSKYHKANDEFWLNNTEVVDASQCNGHPNTMSAAFDTPTQLDASGTDDVWNSGECPLDESGRVTKCTKHVESAAPSIFGRSFNALSGQYEYLLFDPHLRLLENTVDNPAPDGGGLIHYESNSKVWCSNAPRSFLNEKGCRLSYSPFACEESNGGEPRSGVPNPNNEPVLICGSVGEVANDLQLGSTNGYDLLNSDVSKEFNRNIYLDGEYKEYKNTVWANHALDASDQLRARVAWALYQIIPIGTPNTDNTNTETWLQYYDIFVRNAFGNFKDILKQISFTDVMSEWLTFSENKSLQWNLDDGKGGIHPDENYAREVMQLFSIGIFQLNRDGTKKLDANGIPLETYDSSDIMNFARAWTGFDREYRFRGNAESGKWGPHVDPMHINREFRDIYPKSNLLGGYIGDGYPLCADLPAKDHLRKGAAFRLQGRNSNPSLQLDWFRWASTNPVPRLELTPSSPLYSKLCALEDGVCTFPGKVVLDENLVYDAVAQTGAEYTVDTIRTLRIDYEGNSIYYEYLRPPCVDQAFLGATAKKTIRGDVDSSGTNAYAVESSVCADPRRYIATEMCCNPGWEDSWDVNDHGFRYCSYHAERVRYDTAVDRCAAQGKIQCNPLRLSGGGCAYDVSRKVWSSWSSAGCSTRAKISYKDVGLIGRVDYPESDWNGNRNAAHIVNETTANFFKVAWSDPSYSSVLPSDATACSAIPTCYSVDDGCICDTTLIESPVFTSASQITSKDDVISSLYVGSFQPEMFEEGETMSLGDCGIAGLEVFSTKGSDTCTSLGSDAFFGVVDGHGMLKYVKNLESIVTIDGIGASYRNPVHFISMVDQDLRDMYYETDAVIEHFFHHPSHAPFLSLRFLQRFGLSNPSPGLVERVATAYIEGSYNGIGSGSYGDLSALVAAILLDDESRSTTLDSDPTNGSLREPIIKVVSLLRSMEAVYTAPSGDEKLYKMGIGQDSFGSPSVFSFFLPEYQPSGSVETAKLVSPEAQVMNGKQVTTYLDGMFSSVKFGLTSCFKGFGQNHASACSSLIEGQDDTGDGFLSWDPDPSASVDEIIDELSILLTAGRLGSVNKGIIRSAIESDFAGGNRAKAIRIAQQLVLATPEYQVWGALSRNTGVPRQITGYTQPPINDYKNVVYFFLPGGLDSWNLLVPKAGCVGKDKFAEYQATRQSLAMAKDDFLDIDASGQGHSCTTWGVNKYFPVLKSRYDAGEALFFLNTGVLSKPLNKQDDWMTESAIQLFAHNHMSREQLRVDPLDQNPGTGVGGRMLDVLKNVGFQTSGNTVDGSSLLNVGDTYYSNPTSTVTTGDPSLLDEVSSLSTGEMLELTKQLNGIGEDNSLFGETWSERLSKSLFEYDTALEIDAAVKSGEFNMNGYPIRDGPGSEFRAAAQFIKSRHMRKVDREVYSLKHDTSYDTHGDTSTAELPGKLALANQALSEFIAELERQGIWENTVILLGSDFGRSLEPNSNGGSDHGWGGHYFMVGGGVKGGQILGDYPADLNENSDQWIRRGRMIPTTPWDSVWNGISQWMGVESEADLDFILPNRHNFDSSQLFTEQDLFNGPPAPTPAPTPPPGLFEAEEATAFGTGVVPVSATGANTGSGFVDMAGTGSWFEWSGTDLILEEGGLCTIDVRYTLGGSKHDRDCQVTLNGVEAGVLVFADTGGWDNWEHVSLTANCLGGPNTLRITAVGVDGGPNIDSIQITVVPPTQAPTPLNTDGAVHVATVISQSSQAFRVGGTANAGENFGIDGTTFKFLVVKDGTTDPGFEVINEHPRTIVQGLRVYTANDGRGRDPAFYRLEGRKNSAEAWELISEGWLSLPIERNEDGLPINSSPGSPDTSLYHQEVSISNAKVYAQYRFTAPQTRNVDDGIMQLGEIELPGLILSTSEPTTSAPATPVPTVAPVITEAPAPSTSAPSSGLPALDYTNIVDGGTNGFYKVCQGKCLDDSDCEGELVCYQTGGPGEIVPGCSGETIDDSNFCFVPTVHSGNLPLTFIGDELSSYGECEGDCDADAECPTGMLCRQRSRGDRSRIANCDGTGIAGEDYCYRPIVETASPTTSPTATATSSAPTSSPVLAVVPTAAPQTGSPTQSPTTAASLSPSTTASSPPSMTASSSPSVEMSEHPTVEDSSSPSVVASSSPSVTLSTEPSVTATLTPSISASAEPSIRASEPPTVEESSSPSVSASNTPSNVASSSPSITASENPTVTDSSAPSSSPTTPKPTLGPTPGPTPGPTLSPTTASPTSAPQTDSPSASPVGTFEVTPVANVLLPDTTIVRLGGTNTHPTSYAVDGTTDKFLVDTSSGTGEPGFEAYPNYSQMSIVKGIRLYTGNDGPSRDPVKYVLQGRTSPGDAWQIISQGDFSPPSERNAAGVSLSSTYEGADASFFHTEVSLSDNSAAYAQYKVTFPLLRNANERWCQFAEIELPGLLIPTGYIMPTQSPATSAPTTKTPTQLPSGLPTKGPVSLAPTSPEPTPAPTNSPTLAPLSISPGLFEAEEATSFGTGVVPVSATGANTGSGFVDMAGTGSWFEWSGTDLILEEGGLCTIDVRYTLGGSKHDRDCQVTLNGVEAGVLVFADTGGWDNWEHVSLTANCLGGPNTLRITAVGANGGPNIDSIQITVVPPTQAPTSSPVLAVVPTAAPHTGSPTKGPRTESPTPLPTSFPATSSPTNQPVSPTAAPNPSPSAAGPSQLVPVSSVILGSANTVLGSPGCTDASDGTTDKCTINRGYFPSNDEVGFVATGERSVVKKIRIYTANNYKERDPASYSIEGRNAEGDTWQVISNGPISLTRRRNGQGIVLLSTYDAPDTTRKYREVVFENEAEFSQYRVRFPTAKNDGQNYIAFAEVELPGFVYATCAAAGDACTASGECCSGLCEGSSTCA